jgi:hypothetical protein
MYHATPYTPGPGDLMGQYTGHPHDPRTPDPDDDDATADIINDVRGLLDIAVAAVANGDIGLARHALIEAQRSIADLVGSEQ